MCGIVGIIDFNNTNNDLIADINKALKIQNHRGPDDKGFYFNKENETGLLAKDQNLHSLATLIENFFEKNENERKKMRQNSRNRSIKCWSEEVIINKYISLYKKILLDN